MDRAEKKAQVEELGRVFSEAGVVVVTHYSGLSVAEMTDLRVQIRDAGANFKVIKNRLAKIALEGTDVASIGGLLTGPTAIAWSADPVAAPKVVSEFSKKKEKLVIIGGALGQQALDADGVKALASLPSIDELRAKLVGLLQTPASRVAAVLQAPGGQVARVLNAYATKDAA
ncbi:50S ribosomal protein L10 [Futiania mangrovi]|uniref:Large ribosomal subunit protein uL10 n=1 Tax=Futiania mangrovi TaxID=2959716 RepID=A0A9J6PEY0_9PROT|nr:50S ribosomal protein L10 [Futiania mangrovii]MCP1335175.1 50S ribosomal protein L10 [Futiania mangrovii]